MRKKPTPPTGIYERHSRSCSTNEGGACDCEPSYRATVYSRRDGKLIRRTFSGKGALSAAKGWRLDAQAGLRRGTLSAPTRRTLREAAEDWLEKAERGEVLSRHKRPYKPSVLRGYRADFNRHVLPDLGAQRLSDVTADDFQALVERLIGAGLSGSKVRNVLVPAQSLYRYHRRQVLVDPTDGLDLPEGGARRERAASPAEAAALLAALPDEDRAIWATAAYAGLRRGELRALRASDVRGTHVLVERGWDDHAGVVEPKSRAGFRQAPLPSILAAILDEHVERTGRQGDDLLFGRGPSSPFTPSYIRKRAAAAWEAANAERAKEGREPLVPIGLHELRHSYSTYLDAAGISETRADRYMGHANPSVANRYRHQLEGQLAEDARRLDEYLSGAVSGKVVRLHADADAAAVAPARVDLRAR
jgi:integrase